MRSGRCLGGARGESEGRAAIYILHGGIISAALVSTSFSSIDPRMKVVVAIT